MLQLGGLTDQSVLLRGDPHLEAMPLGLMNGSFAHDATLSRPDVVRTGHRVRVIMTAALRSGRRPVGDILGHAGLK